MTVAIGQTGFTQWKCRAICGQNAGRIGTQTTQVMMLGQQYASVEHKDFERDWNNKFLFTYRKKYYGIKVLLATTLE